MFLTVTVITSVLVLSNFSLAFYIVSDPSLQQTMFIIAGVLTATIIGSFFLGNDWWIAYLVLGGWGLIGGIVALVASFADKWTKTSS